MATQKFDELNLFNMAVKWFDKVDVSDTEKKQRARLAMDYCEIIIMLFLMIEEPRYTKDNCVAFAEERLRLLAERELNAESIAFINEWAPKRAEAIVDETIRKTQAEPEQDKVIKFAEEGVEIPESEYWTSDFRALKLGEELSSTVSNFKELSDALNEGKTRKVWMTEGDDRVRKTHEAVHGVDIPINEFFTVGNSQMLMPGDSVNGAELEELANCRCVCIYH